MMFPQVSSVFFNWMDSVQMKVVNRTAVDFESQEDVLDITTFEAVITPMKSKDVDRQPENLRIWKWWDMWSTTDFGIDTVIQDPSGTQFRVRSSTDWSQGGYFHVTMTEQPNGL